MLANRVKRKTEKLAPRQEGGSTTVLLLESRCVALMSPNKMETGLVEAFPAGLPTGVDHVWFADWSCEGAPSYWLLKR
jgi:hypothetical protein